MSKGSLRIHTINVYGGGSGYDYRRSAIPHIKFDVDNL